MLGSIANTTLETLLKAYLNLDPDSSARLQALKGKVVRIELKGLNLHFTLMFTQTGLQLLEQYEGQVDTTIRGSPIGLVRLGLISTPSSHFFAEDVEISGDTELGQSVKDVFDSLDIDWEEHLSHVIGDTLAHQAANTLRSAVSWGQQTRNNLQANLSEYIHEEVRCFPPREELEDFYEEIDQLRDDIERLAARVQRLLRSQSA